MNSSDLIRAGWKSLWQPELPVRIRDGEERMWKHVHIGKHPRMHVALDAHEKFRTGKRAVIDLSLEWLAEVKFFVQLRRRVNIVQDRIQVSDAKFLSGDHPDNIRLEHAAYLIERRTGPGRGGRMSVLEV